MSKARPLGSAQIIKIKKKDATSLRDSCLPAGKSSTNKLECVFTKLLKFGFH